MIVLMAIARLLVIGARRVGDDGLDAADVVGQPALDLAGPRLGEEAQRHALEVRVERAAQVLHDVLADDVVEIALADADQPGDDRQHDHQPDVQVQLLVVAADDDLVEQDAEQERVDQADQARGRIATRTTTTWSRYGRKNATMRRIVARAPLLGDRRELGGGSTPHPASRRPSARRRAPAPPVAARVPPPRGKPCGRPYQAVAVAASVIPWASSQRSASMAALQPSPAAVTAWR